MKKFYCIESNQYRKFINPKYAFSRKQYFFLLFVTSVVLITIECFQNDLLRKKKILGFIDNIEMSKIHCLKRKYEISEIFITEENISQEFRKKKIN